jgi:predicted ribosome quality control (RQC) complex YloA/Tae2 family protein
MVQHYFTLLKLKEELNSLVGSKLIELFSQDKDTITFAFFDEVCEHYLHFSAIPMCPALFIYNGFVRSKSNSVNLCPALLGETVRDVKIYKNERIIEIIFNKYTAFFSVFGGSNSNLLVSENQSHKFGNVVFALKNKDKFLGRVWQYKGGSVIPFLNYDGDKTLLDALAKSELLLGKYYATEFCHYNNLFEAGIVNNLFSNLNEVEKKTIENKAIDFRDTIILNSSNSYILKSDENVDETVFSLIPLTNYSTIKLFDSISNGLKYKSIQIYIQYRKDELRHSLLPKLQRDIKRIDANIKIAENLDDVLMRADKYRINAELLMSQSNLKQRGSKNITITDWNEKEIQIELDQKLTLIENANKYYSKSKKSLEEATFREKRLPTLKRKMQQLQQLVEKINAHDNIKELEKIRNEIIKKSIVIMPNTDRPIDTKFRKIDLGDGFTLFVGKNSANNDELTMKFAKPNDVWLHVRGASGSHCIVQGGNADGKLPKPILKTAAQVAAFYSGAKNAKFVPVCYTQKKYVHKPKGAAQGAVTIQKEEIIMVEPKNYVFL